MNARWVVLVVGLLAIAPGIAREAQPLAADPVLEQRLERLAEELRCVVCQNESLAGSRTEIANDLKREIRTLMTQGRSDPEVVAYLTERYGDFILYRPPFKPLTFALWLGPLLFLGVGAIAWRVVLRRHQPRADASGERV
ncbi:MAG: cytochrome c-type biogenesis protein CcmH [Thiotrichales bacterium]